MATKNSYIHTMVLLWSIGLLCSCEKYLDIKPKGYVIPQTVEDYERLLDDYPLLIWLPLGIEQLSDDFYTPHLVKGHDISNPEYRLYFWLENSYSSGADDGKISAWNILYNRIYQYNAVINGLEEATSGNEQRKAVARGRALVGRALCYYYLNNIYGQIPTSREDNSALGVPLVLSNKISEDLPARSTVNATFDFIVQDLLEGIQLVPPSSLSNFQINRAGAYGWLARTYLTMKEYEKAGQAAEEALKLNSELLDYNTQYGVQSVTGAPDFYAPADDAVLTKGLQGNRENLHIITFEGGSGMALSDLSRQAVQAFDQHDLRRINLTPTYGLAYEPVDYSEWNGGYQYMGFYYNDYSIGPTTAEMYLISAESLARNKRYTEAMEKLNILRKNRIQKEHYQALSHVSAKKTLEAILKERRVELLFKGLRWFDMRRLQNDPDFGFTAIHELADGTRIELAPNSPRYVLAIPDRAITDKIIQNP